MYAYKFRSNALRSGLDMATCLDVLFDTAFLSK